MTKALRGRTRAVPSVKGINGDPKCLVSYVEHLWKSETQTRGFGFLFNVSMKTVAKKLVLKKKKKKFRKSAINRYIRCKRNQ